jgi:hypothetical protein
MKTYKVWAVMETYLYAHVEANSEAEAMAIAQDMDGSEFIGGDDGDWKIYSAEEQ